MDRSLISPAQMRARGTDIAKIPLAAMKVITSPGELGMRLNAYDALVAKARRPHLEPGLLAGYHQLALEVLTTEDRARAVELMKTAGVAPSYDPAEMQQMLRAGTAIRLSNGHICPVGNVRDLRYQVTIAQGAMGRGTPEDSAAFRSFLASRARFLGVPSLIPVDWGRPAARSSAVAAGKSAKGRTADQQATLDHLAKVARDAVVRAAGLTGLQVDEVGVRVRGAHGTIASATSLTQPGSPAGASTTSTGRSPPSSSGSRSPRSAPSWPRRSRTATGYLPEWAGGSGPPCSPSGPRRRTSLRRWPTSAQRSNASSSWPQGSLSAAPCRTCHPRRARRYGYTRTWRTGRPRQRCSRPCTRPVTAACARSRPGSGQCSDGCRSTRPSWPRKRSASARCVRRRHHPRRRGRSRWTRASVLPMASTSTGTRCRRRLGPSWSAGAIRHRPGRVAGSAGSHGRGRSLSSRAPRQP